MWKVSQGATTNSASHPRPVRRLPVRSSMAPRMMVLVDFDGALAPWPSRQGAGAGRRFLKRSNPKTSKRANRTTHRTFVRFSEIHPVFLSFHEGWRRSNTDEINREHASLRHAPLLLRFQVCRRNPETIPPPHRMMKGRLIHDQVRKILIVNRFLGHKGQEVLAIRCRQVYRHLNLGQVLSCC